MSFLAARRLRVTGLCGVVCIFFLASSGCAPSENTLTSGDSNDRRVYTGSLEAVVEQAAKAAASMGLAVEEAMQTDPNAYFITCAEYRRMNASREETARVQVARVLIDVRRLSDRETAVMVESSATRSSSAALGGTTSEGGLKNYKERIFANLDKMFTPREEVGS